MDRRWGHVSLSFMGYRVRMALGWVRGQQMFVMRLPMYWADRNFRVCVIWALVMCGDFHKLFDSL